MAMALAVTHPEDEADPWRRAEPRMSRRNRTRVQHHELLDQTVPEARLPLGVSVLSVDQFPCFV